MIYFFATSLFSDYVQIDTINDDFELEQDNLHDIN